MKSITTKLPVLLALLLVSSPAFAQAGAAGNGSGLIGLGAGLAMGLAAIGAALGQGRAADAALQGMARNPQAAGDLRTSMLLALVFPETLVLFTFAIAYILTTFIG